MAGNEAQRFRCALCPFPQSGKQPGRYPDVQLVRVDVRHRFFVVGKVQGRTTHLRPQRPVGLPVGRAHTHQHAFFHALRFQPVGTQGAGIDLHHQQGAPFPIDYTNVRGQARRNRIGNQATQPLFIVQRVLDTQHRQGAILDPDQHNPASRVGKSDHRLEDVLRSRQILFELQRLSFRTGQQILNLHAASSGIAMSNSDTSTSPEMRRGSNRSRVRRRAVFLRP